MLFSFTQDGKHQKIQELSEFAELYKFEDYEGTDDFDIC